jgi:CTP synthase (UTP-ammonia lyase)
MQSMATAAMRRGGADGAMPEEVAGPGEGRSFTLMRDAAGAVRHRLGDTALAPAPGSRLAALAPSGTRVRMHHRYALNAALGSALAAGGLVVSAASADGIAEAVEAPGQCFHVGLQGHPELGVDAGLAAVWDGFVAAAQTRRADQTPGRTDEATISP